MSARLAVPSLALPVAILAGFEIGAAQTPHYEVLSVGPAGSVAQCYPSINGRGQVAARDSSGRPFIWTEGVVETLPHLQLGGESDTCALNDHGELAGWSSVAAAEHAVVWQAGGLRDLGTFGGEWSVATSINDASQVVGFFEPSGGGSDERGFLLDESGLTMLGTLGGSQSNPQDVNNRAQVVGYSLTSSATHAFLWEAGVMHDLGSLGGDSNAFGINDAGDVVGASFTSSGGGLHAFLYRNGAMSALPALPGANDSFAFDVNEAGTIVGFAKGPSLEHAAVAWINGAVHDLNDAISDPDWHLSWASSINDAGWIAGWGYHRGEWQVFVLRDDCGAETYCAAATNSLGIGCTLVPSGSVSVSANELRLVAVGCPPGSSGLFCYAPERAQVPFGDGFLCLAPGEVGLQQFWPPLVADALTQVELAVDLTHPPAGAGPGHIEAGSTWYFQLWYRDPSGGPAGFNLSNGLRARFCP